MTELTKDRLARVLREVGLLDMALQAANGWYDDFLSPLATPIRQLHSDLLAAGFPELAARVVAGEFDSTKEEAEVAGQAI